MSKKEDKSTYDRKYYLRTKEKRKVRKQIVSKYAAARRRESDLLWRYGLGADQLNRLLESQGNACAICRSVFDGIGKHGVPHIDHLHEPGRPSRSGSIRGLLCNDCNKALGLFRENPDALRAAIAYLENPPAYVLLEPKPQLKLFEERA